MNDLLQWGLRSPRLLVYRFGSSVQPPGIDPKDWEVSDELFELEHKAAYDKAILVTLVD